MTCAPSADSDQPGPTPSLFKVFAVRMKKAWVLSYPLSAERKCWSDWAEAQADLSLRWAHMPFCWFCHDAAHVLSRFQVEAKTGRTYSYVNVIDKVERLAAGLRELGMGPGDVLCMMTYNRIDIPIFTLAVNLIGGVYQPLSPANTNG